MEGFSLIFEALNTREILSILFFFGLFGIFSTILGKAPWVEIKGFTRITLGCFSTFLLTLGIVAFFIPLLATTSQIVPSIAVVDNSSSNNNATATAGIMIVPSLTPTLIPLTLEPTVQPTITLQPTPFYTTEPEHSLTEITISSNNDAGYRFQCPSSGMYEIKYINGSYCTGSNYCRTVILIFVDKNVEWGDYDGRGLQPNPGFGNDGLVESFVGHFGDGDHDGKGDFKTQEEANGKNEKPSHDVPCTSHIDLIAMDYQDSYGNNWGEVTISILGP